VVFAWLERFYVERTSRGDVVVSRGGLAVEMMGYVGTGALVILVAASVAVVVMLRGLQSDVAGLRDVVEKGLHYLMYDQKLYGRPRPDEDCGFSIWTYRNGVWQLAGNYCGEGYEPGPPPTRKGVHEGYSVRQLGVKKKPR
jgi:hypothetical protein